MSMIRPHHLQRQAYVYLRQSTPGQVEAHPESTERQYALADRATALGWDRSQVCLLDQDLGKSGTTAQGRDDFHRLMAAVGLGEVEAVFALEAARLSRSQADWHKLLAICALTDTLIVDHDGVYDPNDFNARILLGFKGTWSHAELHALRLRLQGAKLHKARKGELRCHPPTGYIYAPSGVLVLDPDESVVATLRLLLQQCTAQGSAYGVMRYFATHRLPFPRRRWVPETNGALQWGPLGLGRILAILHNPTDTGTYVYGRRRSQPVVVGGQVTRVRTLQRPQAEWTVILPHAHPAYLSWAEYMTNPQQLTHNRPDVEGPGRQGTPRQGAALLQGLRRCGRCGRRMTVRYYGTGGQRPAYQCDRRQRHDGPGGMCWSVPAPSIDAAVTAKLDRHWQLQLERARYEAQRAERQYDAVEPENRLVTRTLERRWNEKLQRVHELAYAYAEARRTQRLEVSPHERQQIVRLAADFPAVWHASTTTQADRKELWGLLVKQIALTPVDGPQRQTQMQLLWHTDATTELWGPRLGKQDRLRTPTAVVDAVAALAPSHTDAMIAATLNTRGLRSGRNRPFTAAAVAWLRYKHQSRKPGSAPRVAASTEARPDGRYSTRALATHLGGTISTIHYWRDHGIIPAIQETPGGPWWHEITPAVLTGLRQHIRRVPLHIDNSEIPNAD